VFAEMIEERRAAVPPAWAKAIRKAAELAYPAIKAIPRGWTTHAELIR